MRYLPRPDTAAFGVALAAVHEPSACAAPDASHEALAERRERQKMRLFDEIARCTAARTADRAARRASR